MMDTPPTVDYEPSQQVDMPCGCGLPMTRNPHPDAGLPTEAGAKVGYVFECIPCLVATRNRVGSMWRAVTAENERLRALIGVADRMYAEHAAKEQAASNARYQAEFGHNGPSLAGPLGSAGREYVYARHHLSRDHPDMPDAMTALGQRRSHA